MEQKKNRIKLSLHEPQNLESPFLCDFTLRKVLLVSRDLRFNTLGEIIS